MASERASLFEDDGLDLSDFAPTVPAARPKADRKATAALAKEQGFTPREGQRRYRTGRNQQLNLKVTPEAASRFNALVDANGWVQGEAFEHAVSALEAQLKARLID